MSTPPLHSLAAGTAGRRVLHYVLEAPLGEGGMGTVWRARHESLGRVVAIKELHAGLAQNPELRQRFKLEAQALARLQHPGIVSLYDYVESPEGLYLVLEYVEGKPLDRYIREVSGPIPDARAAEMMAQVLDAFAYAHAAGVIHRDVKPANIMVTPEGRLKVLDFGIAKLVGEADKGLTKTGTKMGTVLYMSPEQVIGQPVDARSDIYSLGVLLFEMLTGRYPYEAENATEFAIYNHIVKDPLPDPRTFYPAVSPRMVQILARSTAKEPAARYPNCTEFGQDLLGTNPLPFVSQTPVPVAVPQPNPVAQPTQQQPVPPALPAQNTPYANEDRNGTPPQPALAKKKKKGAAFWVFLIIVLVAGATVGGVAYQNWSREQDQIAESERRQDERRQRREQEERDELRQRDQQRQREELERQRREQEEERLRRLTDPQYLIQRHWVLQDLKVQGRMNIKDRQRLREMREEWVGRIQFVFGENSQFSSIRPDGSQANGQYQLSPSNTTLEFVTEGGNTERFSVLEIVPSRMLLSIPNGDLQLVLEFRPASQ